MNLLWDIIWDFLQGPLSDYGQFALDNLWHILSGLILPVLVVGSAAVASSVAEVRGHGPRRHFVLGLLLPVLYPTLLAYWLPLKTVGSPTAEPTDTPEPERREGAPPTIGRAPGTSIEAAPSFSTSQLQKQTGPTYDEAYFRRVARDAQGNARGPFVFLVAGQELRVERIAQVLPEVVVVEAASGEAKLQTIRLPYAKIDSCTEL